MPHEPCLLPPHDHLPPHALATRTRPCHTTHACCCGGAGMVVWEGSWVLIEALRDPEHWLGARLAGKRVVELGAGTGARRIVHLSGKAS